MGKLIDKKILTLAIIFLLCCFAVYKTPETKTVEKKRSLQESLDKISGYKLTNTVPLSQEIQETLDLDDYIFANYKGENESVNLYIGYYFSVAKMSAAHSPLVCLPSQGWDVDEPKMGQITVGGSVIHYAETTAFNQEQTDLILYWYQSSNSTSPHIFANKISTLYSKLTQNREEHGFVRITVSSSGGAQDGRKQAIDFIKSFYPQFLGYIKHDNTNIKQ